MIEVKNLTKKYGPNVALDGIDFEIKKGEILGFLGPNGAGKSTTMNILTGYLSSTSGAVKINEFDILENPMEAKKHIGYLPELPPLYMDMTVKEYLGFMYDLKKVELKRNSHIEQICRLVKIEHVSNRMIGNLSKGYRQRVGLAQALLGKPEVLILDEPTVGLDPNQIIEIRNLIKRLGEHHTIILSSHILSEIQAVCDRVIIINKGKIVADDTTENLSKTLSKDNSYTVTIDGPKQEILNSIKNIDNIENINYLSNVEGNVNKYIIEPKTEKEIRYDLFNVLSKNNWALLEIKSNQLTLEQVFLKLVDDDFDIKQLNNSKDEKVSETKIVIEQQEFNTDDLIFSKDQLLEESISINDEKDLDEQLRGDE